MSERQRHYRQRVPNPGLNPVAQETLHMLFKGLTYQEIAGVRCRSFKTVQNTVRTLLQKTGTRNTRELIYEAFTRDWLQAPKRYVE